MRRYLIPLIEAFIMAILTNYAIGCTDIDSGQTGAFLFDVEHWQKTGEFKAIGPVFPGLVEFYAWDNETGHRRAPC